MTQFNGTPHNTAKLGDIAKTVLMPGDPLRAKFVAENFLENPVQFNNVRGMMGFTGTYKGKQVSVMGSGMGMPSIGIYSFELFNFYGVENIIRIGTAGGMSKDLDLFDVVVVDASYSESSFAETAYGYPEDVQKASEEVVNALTASAEKLGKKYHKGMVHSSDVFYQMAPLKEHGYDLLCAEMESFALFANARYLNKKAGCVLTISDIIGEDEKATTAEERQTAFKDMMEIALDTAISL
ncbi:MAG: purine-nucleoside phosphorylase [Erysipelotrichaceae bacterium]|nr:purine-nucleoside phosphorylase [Erysipelotrichaceae bacterium]